MYSQTILDKKRNSKVYSINESNRQEVILSLLAHKYKISWSKKGRRVQLNLEFLKKY